MKLAAATLLAFCLLAAAAARADGPGVTAVSCLPAIQWPVKADYGDLPSGVSTRATQYAAWVCEIPNGYQSFVFLYSPPEVASNAWLYVRDKLTLAQANLQCAATCWPTLTDTELAFIATEADKVRARAVVAFNAGALTRSTYAANTDGTLNPAAVGTIPVASKCDETQRIPKTSYFLVAPGQYAICVVSLPYGSN